MYSVRPAEPSDLDRLMELSLALQDHLEASNPDLWQMTPEARSQLESQLAARLTAPSGCALVAERAQAGVVGMAFGRVVTNHRYIPTRAGVIDQVFVEAEHRRAGVASQLVAALCRFFAAEGVGDLSLRYVVGNGEAAGFWAALGFAPRIVIVGAERRTVEATLGQKGDLL